MASLILKGNLPFTPRNGSALFDAGSRGLASRAHRGGKTSSTGAEMW